MMDTNALNENIAEARALKLEAPLLREQSIRDLRGAHEMKYIENFIQVKEDLKLLDGLEKDLANLPEEALKRAEQWLALDKKEREKKKGLIEGERMVEAVKVMDMLPHKRAEVVRLKRLTEYYAHLIKVLDEMEAARAAGTPYSFEAV